MLGYIKAKVDSKCVFFTGDGTSGERNCPKGFERVNGTQCVGMYANYLNIFE